jgi:hypothetical protein
MLAGGLVGASLHITSATDTALSCVVFELKGASCGCGPST